MPGGSNSIPPPPPMNSIPPPPPMGFIPPPPLIGSIPPPPLIGSIPTIGSNVSKNVELNPNNIANALAKLYTTNYKLALSYTLVLYILNNIFTNKYYFEKLNTEIKELIKKENNKKYIIELFQNKKLKPITFDEVEKSEIDTTFDVMNYKAHIDILSIEIKSLGENTDIKYILYDDNTKDEKDLLNIYTNCNNIILNINNNLDSYIIYFPTSDTDTLAYKKNIISIKSILTSLKKLQKTIIIKSSYNDDITLTAINNYDTYFNDDIKKNHKNGIPINKKKEYYVDSINSIYKIGSVFYNDDDNENKIYDIDKTKIYLRLNSENIRILNINISVNEIDVTKIINWKNLLNTLHNNKYIEMKNLFKINEDNNEDIVENIVKYIKQFIKLKIEIKNMYRNKFIECLSDDEITKNWASFIFTENTTKIVDNIVISKELYLKIINKSNYNITNELSNTYDDIIQEIIDNNVTTFTLLQKSNNIAPEIEKIYLASVLKNYMEFKVLLFILKYKIKIEDIIRQFTTLMIKNAKNEITMQSIEIVKYLLLYNFEKKTNTKEITNSPKFTLSHGQNQAISVRTKKKMKMNE